MFTKKIIAVFLLSSAPAFSALAQAELKGCEAKKYNIQQEIAYAKTHDNTHRVAGLEKAYAEVVANCTDASLRLEREADIRKKEQKVAEREQELAEAQASGRADKIKKKAHKLEEAKDELSAAKAELNQ
ncbi:DUF1090 domain-containing protein [Dryocola sp. BD586]|jgi:septin family protein|uniref:DUF1090 domain-containing protein n=1 Tax=Dryocola sp. BD586 TaxID=3133271 RepID=UPI003F508BBB